MSDILQKELHPLLSPPIAGLCTRNILTNLVIQLYSLGIHHSTHGPMPSCSSDDIRGCWLFTPGCTEPTWGQVCDALCQRAARKNMKKQLALPDYVAW